MKKRILLLSAMTILMLSFTGCGKSDGVDVELTEAGDAPIKVISTIQDVTGLEMMEAKEIVDGAPTMVVEDVSQEEAEDIKATLEQAGATVTIK